MDIKDLAGKYITVMGLGRLGGGVGVITFLAKHGARLLVTDLHTEDYLADSLKTLKDVSYKITFILGEHRKQDFTDADIVLKNPAVLPSSPFLEIARKHDIPIETDVSLFLKLSPAPVVGVTGTKGKTTTATLIHAFLSSKFSCLLAGVAGTSPFDFFAQLSREHIVVLELSSFQLADLAPHKLSPHGAVVTNIFPDHLNYHSTFEEYIEAKRTIFAFQNSKDFAVFNADNPHTRAFAPQARGKVYTFGKDDLEELFSLVAPSRIRLKGEHNYLNILAALRVAEHYGIDRSAIISILETFSGVAYRQEFIGEIEGIAFYDDTTATIPDATIAALRAFVCPVILIAGGLDKNIAYDSLASVIKEQAVKYVVLLPGNASENIATSLASIGYPLSLVRRVSSMEEAVRQAFSLAKKGDSVVLSPASASFNLFANEFARGDAFREAVTRLNNNS